MLLWCNSCRGEHKYLVMVSMFVFLSWLQGPLHSSCVEDSSFPSILCTYGFNGSNEIATVSQRWGLNLSRALGDFHYKACGPSPAQPYSAGVLLNSQARPDLSAEQQKVIAVPEAGAAEADSSAACAALICCVMSTFRLVSSSKIRTVELHSDDEFLVWSLASNPCDRS